MNRTFASVHVSRVKAATARAFPSGVVASAVLLVGAGMFAGATDAGAAVTPCSVASLVQAVTNANLAPGGGTVTLSSGCVYTLSGVNNPADGNTGLPVITGKVTVQGGGATIARSSAAGTPSFRIFDVATGGNLTLNRVTLRNGIADNGQQGGGAVFNHGTLAVTGSTFTGNSSPTPTPPSGNSGGAIENSGSLTVGTSTFTGNSAMEGGGVFNQGTATIMQSTFTDNAAITYGGGAIVNAFGTTTVDASTFVGNTGPGGGAIDNDATLNVANSTFFNNTAGTNGGGAIVNFGTANLARSTLSGNTSPYGANLYNFAGFTLTVSSSIVADGVTGGNCGGASPIIDGGYNIDTGSSCGFSVVTSSKINTVPQLQGLAGNGGPTQTMALAFSSPAVDAIPASTADCAGRTDQRGIARPQGPACDIGAYELVRRTTTTTVTTSPNPTIGVPVTVTATVTPSAVGGTVAFTDGTTPIAGCGASTVASGSATCNTTFTTTGVHTVTASYTGDSTSAASMSGPTPVTVSPPRTATAVAVATTPNAAVGVAGVAVFATVSPGAAGGTVLFTDNGVMIPGCDARPVNGGGASCVTAFGASGVHTLAATYSGDATYAPSTGAVGVEVSPTANFVQILQGILIVLLHNFHLFGL